MRSKIGIVVGIQDVSCLLRESFVLANGGSYLVVTLYKSFQTSLASFTYIVPFI